MKTLKAHYIGPAAIAALVMSSGTAMAQSDEIIVTAQKTRPKHTRCFDRNDGLRFRSVE